MLIKRKDGKLYEVREYKQAMKFVQYDGFVPASEKEIEKYVKENFEGDMDAFNKIQEESPENVEVNPDVEDTNVSPIEPEESENEEDESDNEEKEPDNAKESTEELDYNKMLKADLQKLADERGVEVSDDANKDAIIYALEEADSENEK